jgi:hypothetical protein
VKGFYLDGLLGKAISSIENDCISDTQYQEIEDFLGKKYEEKLHTHLSQFVPGDILEVDLRWPLSNGNQTVLIKKTTDKEYDVIKESWEEAGVFKDYNPEIIDGDDWVHLILPLTTRKHEYKK